MNTKEISAKANDVRTGQGSTKLSRPEFEKRYREQFYDPAFQGVETELAKIVEVAWECYVDSRKSPRSVKAGKGFADPEHEVAVEWLETRAQIQAAQERQADRSSRRRILLIDASPRTDETCPSEMAKTFRLAQIAREAIERQPDFEVDFLDMSNLNAEYGRRIFPCKACVSTAMPLCHWPCTCYPNHYIGQVQDWMNELYPRWVAAHGVMLLTPVHWYQAPSVLKLMMDRLVCADGGNPDPTSTAGKDAEKAKALELNDWPFPKHLAGRLFAIVTHGDSVGPSGLRRNLHDWLVDMELIPAGRHAEVDRFIGYYEPYATSHGALDKDLPLIEEVKNAARTLCEAIVQRRNGEREAGEGQEDPRSK